MPSPIKKGFIPHNKIHWSDNDIQFIRDNFFKMTNKQLADSLGMKITTVRTKCYELGLKRMDLEYWDEYHVTFLLDNYKEMGDSEIADILQAVDPKNKGWSKKHVEKKRRYLGLKRTEEEKAAIHVRNYELGCYKDCHKKMWDKIGRAKNGEIREWQHSYSTNSRNFKVIKTDEGFVHYAPWLYRKHFGEIPEGLIVTFKDGDSLNVVPENLELIDRAEHARRNKDLGSYPPDLKELIGTYKQFISQLNKLKDEQQRESD